MRTRRGLVTGPFPGSHSSFSSFCVVLKLPMQFEVCSLLVLQELVSLVATGERTHHSYHLCPSTSLYWQLRLLRLCFILKLM